MGCFLGTTVLAKPQTIVINIARVLAMELPYEPGTLHGPLDILRPSYSNPIRINEQRKLCAVLIALVF